MWWLFENFKNNADFEGAYTAKGWGGQFITVIPKRKLVISHKTAVSLFTRIGLTDGGVSDSQYWNILDKLMTGRVFFDELSLSMDVKDIISLLRETGISDKYDFSENAINDYGYYLLNEGLNVEANEVFQINTEFYPTQYNTFDSYGESLMRLGKTELAIKAYEKSVELNPNNTNAIKMISKLKKI